MKIGEIVEQYKDKITGDNSIEISDLGLGTWENVILRVYKSGLEQLKNFYDLDVERYDVLFFDDEEEKEFMDEGVTIYLSKENAATIINNWKV